MSKQEQKEQDTQFNQQLRVGLAMTYNAMLAFKKYKQSPVIVSRNGKIVAVRPEDMPLASAPEA
jgi:sulfur carrier protein ThiS